jgi:hypothetical protein
MHPHGYRRMSIEYGGRPLDVRGRERFVNLREPDHRIDLEKSARPM